MTERSVVIKKTGINPNRDTFAIFDVLVDGVAVGRGRIETACIFYPCPNVDCAATDLLVEVPAAAILAAVEKETGAVRAIEKVVDK